MNQNVSIACKASVSRTPILTSVRNASLSTVHHVPQITRSVKNVNKDMGLSIINAKDIKATVIALMILIAVTGAFSRLN